MLTLLSIAIIIVTMFKALIGLSINLLQVIYAHASLALSRLKNKQAILKIKPHKFELHPDLTKD